MRYGRVFCPTKLQNLPFKIGYTVLLSLITLCNLCNYRTLMSNKIYVAIIFDYVCSINQLPFAPWEIESKTGILFYNHKNKGRSRPSRVTKRSYGNYKKFWIALQRDWKWSFFFVLKTKVPIQENIGLMLPALSHSVLNFTVQKDLHLFLQMYKAFLLI